MDLCCQLNIVEEVCIRPCTKREDLLSMEAIASSSRPVAIVFIFMCLDYSQLKQSTTCSICLSDINMRVYICDQLGDALKTRYLA